MSVWRSLWNCKTISPLIWLLVRNTERTSILLHAFVKGIRVFIVEFTVKVYALFVNFNGHQSKNRFTLTTLSATNVEKIFANTIAQLKIFKATCFAHKDDMFNHIARHVKALSYFILNQNIDVKLIVIITLPFYLNNYSKLLKNQ